MSIKHTTTVDIGDLRKLSKPIHLMQYDKSLPEIEVHITKDGQEYTIPSGYSATIRWGKPDKHGCTATGTVSGSTVTFQVTEQMACVAGISKVTVEIVESDSSQAGTAKFEVIVDSNPIGDNTIVSDSEIADIQKAIETSTEASNSANASASASAQSATNASQSAEKAKVSETNASNSAKEAKASADSVANVVTDVSKLKEDLADVRTEKETNLLKFINANWTTSNVLVSSDADSSIMHIKADNLTLESQQVFNVMLDNLIILEPNTTYTLSTSIIRGEATQIRANNISLNRRDTYASVALIEGALYNVTPNKQYMTFTTPTDETRFYFTFTFASGAWDCDIDLNINISKGSDPNYSQYGIVVDLNNTLPTIEKLFKHNIYDIVVAKDGSGDYTNLTEAVENAKDFDTIYIKNGVYDNEIIKAWLKTVFIIGESREGVIIKNNTGAYDTPPIEMGTGMLKNLTVYAEGNATPSNKGYALHSESSVSASSCNFFILENCTFKSDYRQSWGMGMRGDTHYYARNCTFERVYFHDCEHEYRATNQYIEFDSCNIVAKADETALLLQDQQMNGANIDLTFNRCLVKSENGANIQYGKWTGSGIEWVSSLDDFPTWHLSTYSFGNSDNALNA